MTDGWTWTAFYADGGYVSEEGHGFGDVDLQRVTSLELRATGAGRASFVVLIDQARGQQPIFFRTRATPWLLAGGEPSTVSTCIGRQETVGDQTIATYVYIDEDGHVVISDRRL